MSSEVSLFESDEDAEKVEPASSKTVTTYSSDDCDVIAETPQKASKKNFTKTIKISAALKNLQPTKSNQYSLNEFCVTRNDKSTNVNSCEVNLNGQYKKPYVFFEMRDILSFTERHQPVNANLKMVGVYEQRSATVHYLLEHRKTRKITPLAIVLDFKLLCAFPADATTVEVYGFITFHKKTTCWPIFVVEFWTIVSGDFGRYLKCLNRQKLYIPSCYRNIKFDRKNSSQWEDVDYYFEEMDESCLDRKIEDIEQICQEIDQIMNISDDVFV